MLNLDKNRKYLLACSYGPDSMALFSMLKEEGYYYEVAHVNYHFRKESDLEERLLREYCKKNGIAIHVFQNTEIINNNLEARAREIRYLYFKKIFDIGSFSALLVAHHQDDLIETYLMQKEKNLHPFYYGINEYSENYGMIIIRPLLSLSKEDLLNYCINQRVPYMHDKSNDDTSFMRNRIRHEIVEKMNLKERYMTLKEIEDKNEALKRLVNRIKKKDLHSCLILKTLNEDEFIYAIQLLINECQIFEISSANINEIHKIIESDKPNVTLHYNDIDFVKEYDYVTFKEKGEKSSYSYTLLEPGLLETPYFFLDFRMNSIDRNVTINDYPLTIRNAHKNDVVKIKTYNKEVRRLFIDWKMPLSLRERWPVIVNKEGKVIYVPRYQKDFVINKSLNFYVK